MDLILWRRLDRPGHEACRVAPGGPAGGRFVADLEVSPAGLVTRYPGVWEAEPV